MVTRTAALFTSEVFARRYLNSGPDLAVVTWAENMVTAGFDSDHLSILVGETAPFNKFEIDALLDRIQSELEVPKIGSQTEATQIIATAWIQRFIRGLNDSAAVMHELAELYIHEEEACVYDFYLLHYAAADLEMDEHQFYWPGANRKNIEKIIRDRCLEWIEEHPLDVWQKLEWQKTDQNSSFS